MLMPDNILNDVVDLLDLFFYEDGLFNNEWIFIIGNIIKYSN